MKVLITEEQVRLLMREFGEVVESEGAWIEGVKKLSSEPRFEASQHEVIAFGEDGEYLGYWDKSENHGFVVNEYIDDNDDFDMEETMLPESFFGDELKLTDLV